MFVFEPSRPFFSNFNISVRKLSGIELNALRMRMEGKLGARKQARIGVAAQEIEYHVNEERQQPGGR